MSHLRLIQPKLKGADIKAQSVAVGYIYGGSMFDDIEALLENLAEHRNGMDDEAFEVWITENYIDAATLDGDTLVFDTSKPLWRDVAQATVNNVWNITNTDWCDPRALVDDKDRNPEFQQAGRAAANRKCCENIVQKIIAATGAEMPEEAEAAAASE